MRVRLSAESIKKLLFPTLETFSFFPHTNQVQTIPFYIHTFQSPRVYCCILIANTLTLFVHPTIFTFALPSTLQH